MQLGSPQDLSTLGGQPVVHGGRSQAGPFMPRAGPFLLVLCVLRVLAAKSAQKRLQNNRLAMRAVGKGRF